MDTNLEKNKILFLQSGNGISGGVANYISLLLDSKIGERYQCSVIVGRNYFKNVENKILYKNANLITANTKYNILNIFLRVFKINKQINNLKINIIHSHALRSGIIAIILKILLKEKIYLIHTNHGLRYLQKNSFKKQIFKIIEFVQIYFSDTYICIRNFDKTILLKDFLIIKNKINKIKIIKLNLPSQLIEINKKKIKSFNSNKFIFLAIGSLISVKQPEKFIDLLFKLKNSNIPFEVKWIGSGPNDNKYKKLALKKEIDIDWLGYCNKNTIINEIINSSFLFLTSKFEVYPTVILEAYSCSTPVISFDFDGANEIIKDTKTGYLLRNENDSVKLENYLIDIKYNLKIYKKLCSNCANFFNKEVSNFDLFIKKYKKIYDDV